MASAHLIRTLSTGNRRTFTLSFWIKKSRVANNEDDFIFFGTDGTGSCTKIEFSTDTLQFIDSNYQSGGWYVNTSQLFRDINGWYHYVIAVDTTQADSANRLKIYVNGEQVTSFGTNTRPSQNYDCFVNTNSQALNIGRGFNFNSSSAYYFSGLMTHVNFVDGTALTPTSFGEFDSNDVWKPKPSPSVTYGTNGFFLKMDNSGNMGLDSSGNSNNFTTNGTITQAKDTPSNVFATGNPLLNKDNPTYSNGNNTCSASGSSWKSALSTIGASSGKYYFEYKWASDSGSPKYNMVGIANVDNIANSGSTSTHDLANSYLYEQGGPIFTSGSGTTFGNTYTAGDIIGCAVDLDNNKIYFHKNGTYQASGNPSSGTNGYTINAGTYYLGASLYSNGTSIGNLNFGNGYFGTTAVTSAGTNASGNGIFEYDVPTGYTALSTKGLDS